MVFLLADNPAATARELGKRGGSCQEPAAPIPQHCPTQQLSDKTLQAAAAPQGSTKPNRSSCTHPMEGHPLTPAAIWGPRCTATPPLSSKPGTETAASPRISQQVKHCNLGSHREEEAQPEKKGFSSRNQQLLHVVIISDICLVQTHRIKPWVKEEPMKPGQYSRITSSKQEGR